MRKLLWPGVVIAASFAGGVSAQIIGGGAVRMGLAFTFPGFISGPVNSNPTNTTPTQPGGPQGSQALGINPGTITLWNNALYGWGSSATGLCVQTGKLGTYPVNVWAQNGNCPISGNVGANNNGFAAHTSRDTVGAFIGIQSQTPQFGSLSGTFTATTFVPTTPLNATQLSNMRVGMAIDTNDATPFSGVVASWAADGTSVTVPAWYTQAGGNAASTPAGSAVTINARNHLYGLNVWSERNSGDEPTQSIGAEMDCSNNTGSDDTGIQEAAQPTAYDGCLDMVNLTANIASFGAIVRGKFNSAVTIASTGLYGINLTPWTPTSGGAPVVANLLTPASQTQACTAGSVQWDASQIYVCTATNHWKRAALSDTPF